MGKKAGSAPVIESAPEARQIHQPALLKPRVISPAGYNTAPYVCACGHGKGAHGSRGCLGTTDEDLYCECQERAS